MVKFPSSMPAVLAASLLKKIAVLVVVFSISNTFAKSPSMEPTRADVAYGTSPRQTLDLYLPEGEGPFPVALFIHGGGWMNGDKREKLDEGHLRRLLDAKVAVASINYRFIADGRGDGVFPPVLAPLQDAKRAVQFLRFHASDWKLNSERVVVFGGSAGGFSSLWLALSPEMAEPDSNDPIAKESSRVSGVAGLSAQTSIDPVQMREWVGEGLTYGGHAFGIPNFNEFLKRRDEFVEWYPIISPVSLLEAGDPPVFLSYGAGLDVPNPDKNYYTHSPAFGVGFQKAALGKGVVCHLKFPGHPAEGTHGDAIDFLIAEASRPQ